MFAADALARFGLTARGIVVAYLVAVLTVLASIDIERRLIPNRIVLPSVALVLVAQTAFFPGHAAEWLVASVGAALFLLIPLVLSPGAIGMGDIKLGLLLGAGLGVHVIDAFVLGFLALLPVAAILFLWHGPAARKATIPLGPFLAFGAIAVALFGVG